TMASQPVRPMQVVSKSAAYPAAIPASSPQVYYRPAGPAGAPQPVQMTYSAAGYAQPMPVAGPGQPAPVFTGQPVGQPMPMRGVPGGNVPQGRLVTTMPKQAPIYAPISSGPPRVVRTSQSMPVVAKSTAARPNTVGGPAYSQSAYETKHERDEQLQNLKELRKTCGLKEIPVNDGLQAFKQSAATDAAGDEIDRKLTREKFLEAYSSLLQDHKVEVPKDEVKNAVFDLFDRDDNNIVDMMELVCGISLLCKGSEDDKIQAVFKVFDENDDGFISMDEMYKFLTSVYKVVLTPAVIGAMNSMGVTVESAEDLASVTSLECFKSADLNHDGRLSIDEFKAWFYGPRNDPAFMFSPVRKLLQCLAFAEVGEVMKLEHRANGGAAFGDLPAAEASAQPPSLSNVKVSPFQEEDADSARRLDTTAWPVVALFAAAGARICRPAGAKRPCTQLRARNDPWFATVKTTELEEALRSLGFDDFPKVQRRNHLTQWIQKLRIPYELVEGALKEVRMNRKAEARKKAKQAANAKREEEKRAKEQRSKQKKFRGQSRRGGLFQFTEGQLRSVLNLCGVQGTSQWPKEDLVKKLERLKIHVADVEEVMAEVEDPGFSRRSRRSRRSRPRSRAEREFYNSGIDDQQVREFLREEYEDWDDRYDSVDDYYRYTMDDEPWESVPWDFDDFLEEDPYERQRGRDYSNADYSTADPWASGSWTYSSSGYGFRYGPGPASSSSPKGTPEETMIQAIQEGWKVDSLSRIQACQLLGLSHSPSLTEVRRVRREMALRWHPDKNPGNANAAVAFQLVMAAAGVLAR
ncbi:unnamed protein product, partial [Effrenium voratum]